SFTDIANATNTTLTFNAAFTDNGSQYRATLSNVCGTTNSTAATLTVNALPVCSITGADMVCTNSTNNIFTAPAGMTGYRWSLTGTGTMTGATNTQTLHVTAGLS